LSAKRLSISTCRASFMERCVLGTCGGLSR
jgi:hypothetical protein